MLWREWRKYIKHNQILCAYNGNFFFFVVIWSTFLKAVYFVSEFSRTSVLLNSFFSWLILGKARFFFCILDQSNNKQCLCAARNGLLAAYVCCWCTPLISTSNNPAWFYTWSLSTCFDLLFALHSSYCIRFSQLGYPTSVNLRGTIICGNRADDCI